MAKKRTAPRILAMLMAVMLVVSCINITALAAGQSSRTVDHIDIGVSLTATIVIDGIRYENLTYTLESSDLTAENLSISSSQGGHSYNLNRVSTSTGSSGIRQFRISGSFPVGTQDSPNYYTVSLKKTVTVSTPTGNVTVPVTFTSSFQYWDAHNDCPGLRGNDWDRGEVIRASGMDFLLGNAETDVHTRGTIHVQKTLDGLALTEGETRTFTFDIYREDGTLYTTISATVNAATPYATTSVSDVPFGTYYVVERAADAEGYTLEVSYQLDHNGETSGRSEGFTLTESYDDAHVVVTNAYAPIPEEPVLISLTVQKVWENDTPSLRPESIAVQLYRDGEAWDDPVTLSDGNGWTHTWTGLDDSFTWTADELNVPDGYFKEVTRDGGILTITNIHEDPRVGEAYVSVHKYWEDNGYPHRPDQVTVQLLLNGEPQGDPVVLNADNGWAHKWYGLNPDLDWTIGELNVPEGYTSTITRDGLYFTVTNSMDYTPTEEPTEPSEEPTEPSEEPTEPSEEPTEPSEEPTEPSEEPTEPSKEPTEPSEEPTEPSEEPTEPSEEPTEPSEEPTEPSEEPTEPSEELTEPSEEPTEPSEEPTEPSEEPTEPSEEPTQSTAGTTAPISPQSDDDMADVPQTGGDLLLWIAMAALSGTGLITMGATRKKED